MNMINNCFYDKYDGEFWEYISSAEYEFECKIPEYEKLIDEEEKILDDNPNLRRVIDDKEILALNYEEVGELLKILDIRDEKRETFVKLIFFKGYKEAYYFFKKIGLINDKEQCK